MADWLPGSGWPVERTHALGRALRTLLQGDYANRTTMVKGQGRQSVTGRMLRFPARPGRAPTHGRAR
jgi:hypothetical protein